MIGISRSSDLAGSNKRCNSTYLYLVREHTGALRTRDSASKWGALYPGPWPKTELPVITHEARPDSSGAQIYQLSASISLGHHGDAGARSLLEHSRMFPTRSIGFNLELGPLATWIVTFGIRACSSHTRSNAPRRVPWFRPSTRQLFLWNHRSFFLAFGRPAKRFQARQGAVPMATGPCTGNRMRLTRKVINLWSHNGRLR